MSDEHRRRRARVYRIAERMVSALGHDVKNVFNPIGLQIALIERKTNDEGLRERLRSMRDAIDRGAELLDATNAVGHLESDPDAGPTELVALLRAAVQSAGLETSLRAPDQFVAHAPGERLEDALHAIVDGFVTAGAARLQVELELLPKAARIHFRSDAPPDPRRSEPFEIALARAECHRWGSTVKPAFVVDGGLALEVVVLA